MNRRCLMLVTAALLLAGRIVDGHHSYAGFSQSASTVEGSIETVKIENPHTLIHFRGADGQRYTVVWMAINGLLRQGFALQGANSLPEVLRAGDRLAVTGRMKREGADHLMLPDRIEHKVHGVVWDRNRR